MTSNPFLYVQIGVQCEDEEFNDFRGQLFELVTDLGYIIGFEDICIQVLSFSFLKLLFGFCDA